MKHYQSRATIQAGRNAVWTVLVDATRYPEWDSGVARVEGSIGSGERLKVYSEINPKRAFPVTVTELVPGERMTWSGGMPLGLFRGVRTFVLAPEDGATRFTMPEEYTGPLLPLVWRSMPDLQPSFHQFAVGLKHEAERAGGGP